MAYNIAQTCWRLRRRANLLAAEHVRQVAVVGASAATIEAAEIQYFRTALASAVTKKCGAEPFLTALRTLGVNS